MWEHARGAKKVAARKRSERKESERMREREREREREKGRKGEGEKEQKCSLRSCPFFASHRTLPRQSAARLL
jgi:hypothetical protein